MHTTSPRAVIISSVELIIFAVTIAGVAVVDVSEGDLKDTDADTRSLRQAPIVKDKGGTRFPRASSRNVYVRLASLRLSGILFPVL